MAKYVLEILDGDRAGDVVAIADRALRVGRKPDNDLVLADEKTSGAHAEIVSEGDRFLLRDLGSTNGTFLDGKRVTELVLSPGDVVTFGRVRCRFRSDDAAAAVGEGAGLEVRRLDTSRLRASSRSTTLLAAVLVAGLAAGGWFFLQGRTADGDGAAQRRRREPLAVADNKLPLVVAQCEAEEGWSLRAAGAGFAPSSDAHTGSGSFAAQRSEAADAADFAAMRNQDPVTVFPLRTVTLRAHVRTRGDAQAALRAVLFSAGDQSPFVFRTGTKMAAAPEWQTVEAVVGVPPGCDRLQVEIAALLPSADSEVHVDDVACIETGQAPVVELRFGDGSPTAIGTGAALAIRSVDADNPAIVLDVRPHAVPAPFAALHRAELCVLSDLGAAITATPTERGFALAASGVPSLQFVLPAEAASTLTIGSAADAYTPTAADGEFRAAKALVGKDLTRAEFQFEGEVACDGRSANGRFRLATPVAAATIHLSFRAERQQASELVRQARRAREQGRPGEALDLARVVATRWPMDNEILDQAAQLAGEVFSQQGETLRGLQRDLDEAAFFSTRGGFERVALGVDELIALYGAHNLGDGAATAALQEQAKTRLAAIDAMSADQQRQRLRAMERAFGESRQPGLAKLVQDYIGKNLGTER
jgi:hypothetical protein